MTDADDAPPDLHASAAIIAAQRARTQDELGVDGRLLFGVWGVAWLVGFGGQWLAWRGDGDHRSLALAVFFALLVGAGTLTMLHIGRRTAGVQGTSSLQGAMYGWSWFLAMAGIGALAVALGRADVSGAVVATVMTVASSLLVGALYMAAGAMWTDRAQFALGAWICVVTAVGAVVGLPHLMAVMAFAGGGGMLAAAAWYAVARRSAREAA